MGRNRFVVAETTRLDLSDGDWIEVKNELSYGEQQRISSAALNKVSGMIEGEDQAISVDLERYNVLRLETWLVDWSFCGSNGKQVPISRDAIAALDQNTAAEVNAALEKHITETEQKKAGKGTGSGQS
jgi:hypothetical protein